MAELVDASPGSKLSNDPELPLLRAEAALRLGDAHETVSITNDVLAQESLASPLRAQALLLRSSASRLRGFPNQALQDASIALTLLEGDEAPVETRIEAHRQLGLSLSMAGETAESVQQHQKALELCARTSDLRILAAVHAALGTALGELGQLSEALVHFNHARAACLKLGDNVQISDVLNNLGNLHFLLADYQTALPLLEQGLQLAQETGYRRTETMILITMGDTLSHLDRCDEAILSYSKAIQLSDEVLEPRLGCNANIGLGSVYISLTDFEKAKTFLHQAAYEARRLKLNRELASAYLAQGVLAYRLTHYTEAKEKLESGIGLLQEAESPSGLVKGYLYLAMVHLRTRHWARLRESLQIISDLVKQIDLMPELVREGKGVPEVIEYAASRHVGGRLFGEVTAELLRKLGPEISKSTTLPKEFDAQQRAYPRVEVYSLGKAEVYVNGRLVSEAEWESQKAKEFFYYLMSDRMGKRREQLLEVLWPEVSIGLSRNAFYNNVYRSRRALYQECIVQNAGVYRLNPDGEFWFDAEEFQSLVGEAELCPRGSGQRASLLAQAIKLYHGSFLEEFYSEWSDTIRMELEALYLQSLARLAGHYAAKGEYDSAISLLENILLIDESDSEAHEHLIKLLLLRGDLSEARRHHLHYTQMVTKELGEDPPKTFAVLRQEAGISP